MFFAPLLAYPLPVGRDGSTDVFDAPLTRPLQLTALVARPARPEVRLLVLPTGRDVLLWFRGK